MTPGEYKLEEGEISLNTGRATATVVVANRGDRPIQVGSHFHFFEVNPALAFELSFLNKCESAERVIVSEYFQRCFGQELAAEQELALA